MKENKTKKTKLNSVQGALEFVESTSKSLYKGEALYLAIKVISAGRKISKGLATESEVFGGILGTAKTALIMDGVSISATALLKILKEVERKEKRKAAEKAAEEQDDDIEDLDVDDLDDETEEEEPVNRGTEETEDKQEESEENTEEDTTVDVEPAPAT